MTPEKIPQDIEELMSIYKQWPQNTIPSSKTPLYSRLAWRAVSELKATDREAKLRSTEATNDIRGNLIPAWNEAGLDLYTISQLINKRHLKGTEHIVFEPYQAAYLLDMNSPLEETGSIAGVVRSLHSIKTTMTIGRYLPSASAGNTPFLLDKLSDTVEEIFPQNNQHPAVDEDTIYDYMSAIQYAFILIHPFYEGNGRTSEDLLYALWQRRPDLKHTARYISSSGTRQDGLALASRERRLELICFPKTQEKILNQMGIKPEDGKMPYGKTYYEILCLLMDQQGLDTEDARTVFSLYTDTYIESLITRLPALNYEQNEFYLQRLADNLASGSPIYEFGANVGI